MNPSTKPHTVAILAGGQGSRLLEETRSKSKAMVPIGDQPILWHIIKYYAHFGFENFVIALGYKGETIQEYFATHDFERREAPHRSPEQAAISEVWRGAGITVTLVDTGLETENGGRIKRLAPFVGDRTFMLTWCDILATVDLDRLLAFHQAHGGAATLTAVHPPARFGRLGLDGDRVSVFQEKVVDPNEWINGAFFALEPEIFSYIGGDGTHWERESLVQMATAGELMAFRHETFWQCMDTLKESQELNTLWNDQIAPWKVWEE